MQGSISARQIIDAFPYTSREYIILNGLVRFGEKAFKEAMMELPYSTRMIYINAFQSFIWNSVAVFRLACSREIICGDLIDDRSIKSDITSERIREVTEEDLLLHGKSIDDVVLPLFGRSVKYPSNDSGRFYKTVLLAQGLIDSVQSESFTTIFDVSMTGAYRYLRQKVVDLELTINHDGQTGITCSDDPAISLSMNFKLPAGSFATAMISELTSNSTFL